MGAPPGADGRHRPRLHPARDADAAAAGEADARPARCSATTGRRPAATASSGSSTSRRSATRAGDRRRDHRARARASTRDAGLPDVEVLLNSIGDAACRPAYIERADRATTGRTSTELPPVERERLERNPLRLLDSKDPAMAALNAARAARSPTACARRAPTHFAAVRAHLDALGVAYRIEPRPRPRPRLLHADGVRVLPGRRRGPAVGDRRRRALRRPGRAARRPADAGIGFGLGLDRVVLALEAAGAAAAGRARARWRSWWAPIPTATAERLRVATELRAAGLGARAELGRASSAASSRRRPRRGPLRGHPGRRAGRRPGPAARPAGRHPAGRSARRLSALARRASRTLEPRSRSPRRATASPCVAPSEPLRSR